MVGHPRRESDSHVQIAYETVQVFPIARELPRHAQRVTGIDKPARCAEATLRARLVERGPGRREPRLSFVDNSVTQLASHGVRSHHSPELPER